MKTLISAWSMFVLGLALTLCLSGCGSVGSNSTPAPTPTPGSPGPTPTPAAHGTFVFQNYLSANNTLQTAAYSLNADGSLTVLAGSPFSFPGGRAAGNFLIVVTTDTVTSYLVDASSGALTKAGSGTVAGASAVVTDSNNVYVAGAMVPASAGTGIYGFSLAGNGALTPLAGSPYFLLQSCELCDTPFVLAMNNTFLIEGGTGFHGGGDFAAYPRGAGGVLGTAQALGTDAIEEMAIKHPTGNIAFAMDVDAALITEYNIDASGKPTQAAPVLTFLGIDFILDTTGKFLLLVDNAGVVHVFSIDPGTGVFSPVGTSEAAGNGATAITMDPSGRFAFVTQQVPGTNLPNPANQITVFTFDPATGAMKKLQSYPQPGPPGVPVFITH